MAPGEYSKSDQLVFIHHCINGDIDEVRAFLSDDRADPCYYNLYNGWTALHYAANCGQAEIVRALIEVGFEREAEGFSRETPYDVACCEKIEDLHHLLSLLHFEGNLDYRRGEMPGEATDTAPSSRRGSGSSGGYTPPFTSRPPGFFPTTNEEKRERKPLPLSASRSTSFDFTSGPGSPGLSPSSPSYSYGRRDSMYRTRFLLVRTSHGGGKEAYTRVTLPGGSGVEQLKKTIEKAMKGRRVDSVYTLPEGKIIQFDEQICAFANSQKIDVIFTEGEPTPEPVGDTVPSSSIPSRKSSCPERPSTSYSTHPSLSRKEVSMDIPTTIREGSPDAAATPVANGIADSIIMDASLVEIPSEAKEIDYSIVNEEKEEEEVKEEAKEEEVKKEEEEEKEAEEIPKEPTPMPVTPTSPTVRTIPVQQSEESEEEEEEEEEEVVEKSRPIVIRKTTSEEEKREPEEELPKKVESVKSEEESINGGFEEVSRDDIVEATKEETVEIKADKKEEEPKEPVTSTTNGHTVPKVVLTKADSSSSPLVDFINEHPELVRQLVVVGVVGAACGVAYMVIRKHR